MPLTNQRLSDLIGSIYDCAIDPDRWPGAIEKICGEVRCSSGNIMLIDYQRRQVSHAATWNFEEIETRYSDAIIKWWDLARNFLLTRPLDEPYASSRFDFGAMFKDAPLVYLGEAPSLTRLAKTAVQFKYHAIAKAAQRYIGRHSDPKWDLELEQAMRADGMSPSDLLFSLHEGARKRKIVDTLGAIVLRDRSRVGLFSADRPFAEGFVRDDTLDSLRMIAPHIRRAVAISDLLNLKAVEAQALSATLDKLALGVVIVAAGGRILYANDSAEGMLASAGPIKSLQGTLHASGPADAELQNAVALAEREAEIGKAGIAIALANETGEAAIAHVLPLAAGHVRSGLLPQAAAAVFITRPGTAAPADLSGFAEIFRLTPAEARVLEHLVHGGATMLQIANALSVSEATAKTHLSHILAKTGVGRQAELVALVRDLVPPLTTMPTAT